MSELEMEALLDTSRDIQKEFNRYLFSPPWLRQIVGERYKNNPFITPLENERKEVGMK